MRFRCNDDGVHHICLHCRNEFRNGGKDARPAHGQLPRRAKTSLGERVGYVEYIFFYPPPLCQKMVLGRKSFI